MKSYDIILGIDWFFEHYASILCQEGKVVTSRPDILEIEFKISRAILCDPIISTVKAQRRLVKGHTTYLVSVVGI